MALAFALPGGSGIQPPPQQQEVALRGAISQEPTSSLFTDAKTSYTSLAWLAPPLAALGVARAMKKRSSKANRICRMAAAAAAPEEEEEPAEPAFDPSKEPGVTLPLMYFDPAGFCSSGDKAEFRKLRTAELKHGRVAMMAALGSVVQHSVKFPGFEAVPGGLGALTTPPGTYGFVALVLASGAMELLVWTEDESKEPGDFGDPAGWGQYNKEWRNRELNNGRFAMIAAFAIIVTELITGKDGVDQILTPLSNLPVE
mmetsp:Transcript_10351/g.23348  ORF Transcript_10351/g.23348 Transcript_10351/m.23348 type:complete len:257 (-) Transcript_10351:55-825(-)|eukprot:CAMPEP_0178422756 /NCGR_PEP_ID=MMETSP0689_2-20121128/27338_1 /TAXON_ID=160604 /ORGANISM="Amphidinium massartii, Strain CS-259" /LENGTH=256 /DNA_ID=CAMNT_0020044331 /DNA_START=86 /DNA_END=856 /DNA_ORIENTATION=-